MTDRPLAHGEVSDDQKRGQRKQNGNSTFHLFLGATPVGLVAILGLCGPLSNDICHDDVTGSPNLVN
jgi:hypothetical protein